MLTFVLGLFGGPSPLLADGHGAADRGGWFSIETGHTRIIFQRREQAAARHVAGIADETVGRVAGFMGHSAGDLRRPIDVVLYGGTARANGFFSSAPAHVALFVSSPAGPWLGAQTSDWLELVLTHELVHYFQLTDRSGMFGMASRVFGPLAASASSLFMPGWMFEGIAVYGETRLTQGGRGRNPYFGMLAIAPILEDRFYTYDQAGVTSAYAPRGRIYSAGYLLVDYLQQTYGPGTFAELNERFMRWPILGMRRAIRRTAGEPARHVFTAMQEDLQERNQDRASIPGGSRVSPAEPADWFLVGSDAERLYAYRVGPFDTGTVFSLGVAESKHAAELGPEHGWERELRFRALDEYSVAVAVDGQTFVGVAPLPSLARGATPWASSGDLFVARRQPDGGWGAQRRITRGALLFHPAVSAVDSPPEAGSAFIVAVARDGQHSHIVSVDPETGKQHRLTSRSGARYATPSLSTDGGWLAAVVNRGGRQSIELVQTGHTQGLSPRSRALIDMGGPDDAEYRPRIISANDTAVEMVIVTDHSGFLEWASVRVDLHGVDTSDPRAVTVRRLATDPVSITDALPAANGQTYYTAYRAAGYQVRVNPASRTAHRLGAATRPLAHAAAAPAPPLAPIAAPADRDEVRYRDWPRPVLWLPGLSADATSGGNATLVAGASVYAVSPLQRHNVVATILSEPTDGAWVPRVEYQFAPGPMTLSLTAEASTREPRYAVSLALARPLWQQSDGHWDRRLGALAGVSYAARDTQTDMDAQADFDASVGGSLSRLSHAPMGQVFGGVGSDLRGSAGLSVADWNQVDPFGRHEAILSLGSASGRARLRPGLAYTHASDGSAGRRLPWTVPLVRPGTNADTAFLGRLGFGVAIGPMDAAWRGLAVQETGVEAFVEQAGHPGAGLARSSVVGAELRTTLRFNQLLRLPIAVAAAASLPHAGSNGTQKIGLSLRIGNLR